MANSPTANSARRRAMARRQVAAQGRQRASHSLDAVLTEAVALLDEAGEPGLTFRALAARLGGGVASVYWYVSSKDELLDRAADHAMEQVLIDTDAYTDGDPFEDLRGIGVTLFDAIVDRIWLGAYFMRNTEFQPNCLELYERIGQRVLALGLTARQTFHGASAIVGFVVGTAADMGMELPKDVLDGTVNRDDYLRRATDAWRDLDPSEYPFLHAIIDEFAGHDDADQFTAGLDLILAGLRLQAERARG